MRVADYIAKFIYEHGTKHVFLLTGGGTMHLIDGLACNKDLKVFCLHHEQAISMAIEAYTRAIGKMGVGYFTTGPGATNALTGLAGAWLDSTPCLFISGQVKRSDSMYLAKVPGLRQIGVQEINILPIVQSITKYSAFIDEPNDIRYHLEKAYYLANNKRPGPVWLDIPLDVQGATIDPDKLRGFTPEKEEEISQYSDFEKISQYLKSAKRPVILAGRGVRISGAIDSLLKFATKYKIPVVTTYLGVDIIEYNHLCYAGVIGIKGTRSGNLAVQNSDLLIVIGSSLPTAEVGYEYGDFAREAKIIVVDIDLSSHMKKTIKIDKLLESDAKEFIEKIGQLLGENFFKDEWLKKCASWKNKYPVCLPEYAKTKNRVNIYYFIDQLSKKLKNKDVVVTDAGSAFYAGSQGIKIKKGVRYVTSGGFATMGYSLPASVGISAGLDKKKVICINGDGSFQQNIQELQTVVHHKLPIKIFVLNNEGYLSVRFTQNKFFNGRLFGEGPKSGVSFPDTQKIAKAYGIKFVRVKHNKNLNNAIDKALKYNGPFICEVMTPQNQEIIPTIASKKNPNGSMVSKPLEDMWPFLDRDEFKKEMIIKPLDENGKK